MCKMLKSISEEEFKSLVNIKINHDNFDENFQNYHGVFLDVFNHQLTFEEANEFLGYFENHNLKYEDRFINFMRNAYELNKHAPIVVEVYFDEISSVDIIRILSILDYRDKIIFIDLIRNNQCNFHFYLAMNEEIICLLTKLSTRELLFSTFFFTGASMAVAGNFDLSFPIFFKDKSLFDSYVKMAKESELFLREKENECGQFA